MTVLEQTREGVQPPMQTGTFNAKMISKLGTWNVRTLCEGGKLAQLLHEFDNYNFDILGVSEMCWTGSGKIVSDGKSVLYSGHEEHHIHGVRFVLSKKASCALLGWKHVNDRIITARFQSGHTKTSIIQVYAPTEDSDDDQKDTFYGLLQDTIDEILTHDVKLLIGDFNAQITDNRRGLENVIGPHSSGRQTNNADPDKETTAERYRQLDRAVKRSCKSDKKAWLECKRAEAHEAASKNDNKTLYRIVRELTGAWSNSSAPIKNKDGVFLLTREEQDAHWVEHFKETLNQPTPANTYDFGATLPPPDQVVNLDLITIEETKVAIQTLKANKTPGLDEIAIVNTLTVLLNKCWQDQSFPSDWRKGVIVKLPKKGNTATIGGALHSSRFLGKFSAAFYYGAYNKQWTVILWEEQAGFRAGRSCSEQIYTLCNIIEQCIEFQRPLFINIIDFKKAFDSVHRDSLWKIL
ncbi:hypothetical protein P4O66_002993 [Electrophorus voltai]|uniref:Reverse transcriptase domain-containing protein n=1 Tax=Electrophorus voltai TaxID=2609070 RepID=A0AAD8YSU6_9TELE|nr:hypothetical protein P4O66_002993 [Electrophorus voltai]